MLLVYVYAPSEEKAPQSAPDRRSEPVRILRFSLLRGSSTEVRPEVTTPMRVPAGFGLVEFFSTKGGKLQDHYEVDPGQIGEGNFATVIKATVRTTGQAMAVKAIEKARMTNTSSSNVEHEQRSEASRRVQTEVTIMSRLKHPHIVELMETFEDDLCWYIVMELCEGGELFDRIIEAHGFSEFAAAYLTQQVLGALCHMHSLGIAYCDLKPENLLLLGRAPIEQSTLKLVDFGLSQ